MIKSMTGYGRAEAEINGHGFCVEFKSVNHRFLHFFAKLPPELQCSEAKLLALVKEKIQRGQVSVFASFDQNGSRKNLKLFNVEAAKDAANQLRLLADELGIEADLTLGHLLSLPSVLSPETSPAFDQEELWDLCLPVFEAAMKDLEALRAREGKDLENDLKSRLSSIFAFVDHIEERRPEVVEEYRTRLIAKIADLEKDIPAELLAERLAMEVALYADKSDVAEELVRLRSHVAKFRELLETGGCVGRKLDFLMQEMHRETNTIGSKASDAEVSRMVVEIKSELEKIREQVQNIE